MGGSPTIDFGKYEAGGAAPSIDFTRYSSAPAVPVTSADWDSLKDKYSLPHSVDLSKSFLDNYGQLSKEDVNKIDPEKFSKAYQEANPETPTPTGFFGRAWDEAKNVLRGATSESAIFGNPVSTSSVGGYAPPNPAGTIEAGKQRLAEAQEHPLAAAGAATTDVAAMTLPLLLEKSPELFTRENPSTSINAALTRKLSAEEASTPHPGGKIQPALNNTPAEVLNHVSENGGVLTPGQATDSPLAQNFQKTGRNAAIGGKELASALDAQRSHFGGVVNDFMDEVDPKRAGLSEESAGGQIQDTAKTAKSVSHDNAAQGYQKIDYLMDQKINPQPISDAWNKLKPSLPMGAEDQILAQTPRSMRAVVEDMLSGNPEGFKPTFNQGIQLRKFFRDMGDTDGLPSQTQAIFKQLSGATDGAMSSTAAAMSATKEWRDANAGWKDYATKYGDPQSILYKIGRTQDPTKIVAMLQNAPATDIATIKAEGMDAALEPLKRQVVQDIARNRFNVSHYGLGGYSDSYLRELFGPEQAKELYLNGDWARRLQYDPNPSGTAGGIQSLDQLTAGNQAKMTLAAKLSMPRDPLSFLQSGASRTSLPTPITSGPARPALAPLQYSTDSLGLKWATNGADRVTIPKSVGASEVDAYARKKLAEQAELRKPENLFSRAK